MDTWYKIFLTGDIQPAINKVINSFIIVCGNAGSPKSMAIFQSVDRNGATIYFPPELEKVALQFNANACEKPSPNKDLDLLIGEYSAWNIHFPGFDPMKEFMNR